MNKPVQHHLLPCNNKPTRIMGLVVRNEETKELKICENYQWMQNMVHDVHRGDHPWRPHYVYISTDEHPKEGDVVWVRNRGGAEFVDVVTAVNANGVFTDSLHEGGATGSYYPYKVDKDTQVRKVVASDDPDAYKQNSHPFQKPGRWVNAKEVRVAQLTKGFLTQYVEMGGEAQITAEYEETYDLKYFTNALNFEDCKRVNERTFLKVDDGGAAVLQVKEPVLYTREQLIQACHDFYTRCVRAKEEKKPFNTKEYFDNKYPLYGK